MTPGSTDTPAAIATKPFALRAQAFASTAAASQAEAIRQHQHQQQPAGRWGHFKPPRWGHCKLPLSFLAHPLVTAFVETLDLTIEECYIGSPEGKGKVERLGQTLKHRWADLQPDSTRGPKRNNGDLYPAQREPNLYERARGLFQAVFEYNTQWPHSKLGGRPPALAWEEKAPQVETFAPEELLVLMEAEPATVGQKGIARFNDHYWAPELYNLVGEPVEIRFVRGDTRQVEVLRDGHWLCSAVPNTERSDEDDDRYSELERAEVRRLNDLVRAANRAPRPRRTRTALTVAGAASPLRDASPEQPLRVSSNAELIALADLAAMRRHRRSA
ncbi:MAG TPA: Mu transposase C-terminal domain-containing protein [Solirubrobacteraceae bacterium]|nr:Mu transposase C-terminal domain-containing protein [Solirubrobacteraceae bacterium]